MLPMPKYTKLDMLKDQTYTSYGFDHWKLESKSGKGVLSMHHQKASVFWHNEKCVLVKVSGGYLGVNRTMTKKLILHT